MFVATGAYLAAVFLVGDARRAGEADLERYFVRRALAAAAVAGVAAAVGLIELHAEARYVFDRLVDQGLPLVILRRSAASASGPAPAAAGRSGAGRSGRIGRGCCGRWRRCVIAVIWGWGVAQFPYLLPTCLRIDQAAAPDPTLTIVFIVFARRRGARPALARPALHAQPAGPARGRALIEAVLFDIDGTLLVTGGAGAVAWQRAFRELYEVDANIEEHTTAGMTDPEIAAIVFREVIGREGSEAERATAIAAYLGHLAGAVEESSGYRVMPGIEELLPRLAGQACCSASSPATSNRPPTSSSPAATSTGSSPSAATAPTPATAPR